MKEGAIVLPENVVILQTVHEGQLLKLQELPLSQIPDTQAETLAADVAYLLTLVGKKPDSLVTGGYKDETGTSVHYRVVLKGSWGTTHAPEL